jgi:hypothetical protein
MGTKSSGRPGGNPALEKFQFTTDKDESCTAILNLRVPPSMLAKLKALPNWTDKAREKLSELITD